MIFHTILRLTTAMDCQTFFFSYTPNYYNRIYKSLPLVASELFGTQKWKMKFKVSIFKRVDIVVRVYKLISYTRESCTGNNTYTLLIRPSYMKEWYCMWTHKHLLWPLVNLRIHRAFFIYILLLAYIPS